MKIKTKKYIYDLKYGFFAILLGVILIPVAVYASWWNPITWFAPKVPVSITVTATTTTPVIVPITATPTIETVYKTLPAQIITVTSTDPKAQQEIDTLESELQTAQSLLNQCQTKTVQTTTTVQTTPVVTTPSILTLMMQYYNTTSPYTKVCLTPSGGVTGTACATAQQDYPLNMEYWINTQTFGKPVTDNPLPSGSQWCHWNSLATQEDGVTNYNGIACVTQ